MVASTAKACGGAVGQAPQARTQLKFRPHALSSFNF